MLGVSCNEVGAGHDDLEYRPSLVPQQVDLVNHQQPQSLHVAPRLPAAADAVPLLRRGHNHVCSLDGTGVRGGVSCQLHHPGGEEERGGEGRGGEGRGGEGRGGEGEGRKGRGGGGEEPHSWNKENNSSQLTFSPTFSGTGSSSL